MFSARTALGFLLISGGAVAQQYMISTVAGGGVPVNVPGLSAALTTVGGVIFDAAGNGFFASGYSVLRLDAQTRILTLAAGNGTPGFGGDNGPATSAQLGSLVSGLAIDSAGDLYIADTNNGRIRKVSKGIITTVAGNGTTGFSGDNGPATSAQFVGPEGVAVDSAGNLYIAEAARIRKVSNGIITTVAGNGTTGFSGDNGLASSAQVAPRAIAVDSAGNLYIADASNHRIRKVSNGIIVTIAGDGMQGFSGDNGPAATAQLYAPNSIAVDAAANLYVVDSGRIRKISSGVITTVAGGGDAFGDNAPATSIALFGPQGVAVDATGSFYITDYWYQDSRVRKISNGTIITIAGNGSFSFSGDNGPATRAQLYFPQGVAVDSVGNLYIADTINNRIRKVSNGVITTVAGGGKTFADNVSATSAVLNSPQGVAVDVAGNLYIADTGTNRIRKVANGIITTIAGNTNTDPNFGSGVDNGPATGAYLAHPSSVAVDTAGNLYIADNYNGRVRKVAKGIITTVAGGGSASPGDNGPATGAQLRMDTINGVSGVAVDSAGNLYIADTFNQRVRKVTNGVITTIAGNGMQGFDGDNGPAATAQLNRPSGIALDSAGNVYVADAFNLRIRKIENGIITTVAGNGSQGFGGDGGPAVNALFNYPGGNLAADSTGNIYSVDVNNFRVRQLTPSTATAFLTAVTNGASNLSTAVSPGEIIVLYGSGLGPAQIVAAHVGDDGRFGTQLGGTNVSFNGIAAPITYTSATQVSAVVPYGIAGGAAQVTVSYKGQTTAAFAAQIAASAPGVFTSSGTGKGQAAAVNQDNSLNTVGTPAKVGDVIVLFATGEGQTTPGGADGKPATVPLSHPNLPVTVTIGGQNALVQYAGGAPGEIAGLMQINAQIPSGIQTGTAVPVVVQVGSAVSQPGVTIAVQ